jgi:hypothetical protein
MSHLAWYTRRMKNMKHNIQNASPFKTKQLGDKLNEIIERNPKLELTRDDKDMIHIVALLTFIVTLLGTALVVLALTF